MSNSVISDIHGHDGHDDGSKTTVGFWIYLMSDCLIFSVLFATFGVGAVPHSMRLTAIVVLCVAQLLLQLVCFLHLGSAPDQRENTAVFVCTGCSRQQASGAESV